MLLVHQRTVISARKRVSDKLKKIYLHIPAILRVGLISLKLSYHSTFPGWYYENEILIYLQLLSIHMYFIYRDKDCIPITNRWMLSLISVIKSQFQTCDSKNMLEWLFHIERELDNL